MFDNHEFFYMTMEDMSDNVYGAVVDWSQQFAYPPWPWLFIFGKMVLADEHEEDEAPTS